MHEVHVVVVPQVAQLGIPQLTTQEVPSLLGMKPELQNLQVVAVRQVMQLVIVQIAVQAEESVARA